MRYQRKNTQYPSIYYINYRSLTAGKTSFSRRQYSGIRSSPIHLNADRKQAQTGKKECLPYKRTDKVALLQAVSLHKKVRVEETRLRRRRKLLIILISDQVRCLSCSGSGHVTQAHFIQNILLLHWLQWLNKETKEWRWQSQTETGLQGARG